MKLEGTSTIPAPRESAWQHLMNPAVLAKSLPGCEKMEPNPDGSFQAQLKLGVGAIKGTYQGRVEILDPAPPSHFRMKVEGKGVGGFVSGEATLTLSESSAAETLVTYTGNAQVGGVIAAVGQRLLQSAAKQLVNQFFRESQNKFNLPRPQVPPNRPPANLPSILVFRHNSGKELPETVPGPSAVAVPIASGLVVMVPMSTIFS